MMLSDRFALPALAWSFSPKVATDDAHQKDPAQFQARDGMDAYLGTGNPNPLSVLVAQSPKDSSKADLKNIVELINNQQKDAALPLLEEYVNKQPDDALAQYLLGYICSQINTCKDSLLHLERAWELASKLDQNAILLLAPTLADVLVKSNRAEDAVRILSDALAKNPFAKELVLKKANILLRLNQFKKARETLDPFLQKKPDDLEARKLSGLASYKLGEKDKARADWRTAYGVNSNDSETALWFGVSLLESELVDQAITVLKALVERDTTNTHGHYYLGVAQMEKKAYDSAIISLDRSIEVKNDNNDARNARGIVLWRMKKVADAIEQWRKVADGDSTDFISRINLGTALLIRNEKGDFKEAFAAINEAIRCEPNNAMALVSLGVLHSRNDNPVEAIKAWRGAIERDESNYFAHVNLGYELYWANNIEESIKELTTALKLQPRADSDTLIVLALALNRAGRLQEAVDKINTAIKNEPTNSEVHYWRGFMLGNGNNLPDGVNALRESLKHNPKNLAAHDLLAGYLSRQGDHKAAALHWMEALKQEPSDAAIRTKFGSALLEAKDYSAAAFAFRQAIRLNPGQGSAYRMLGEALWNLGQQSDARQTWEEGVRRDPTEWMGALFVSRALVKEQDYIGAWQGAQAMLAKDPGNKKIRAEMDAIEDEWWRERSVAAKDSGFEKRGWQYAREAVMILNQSPRLTRRAAMKLVYDSRPDQALAYFKSAASTYDDANFHHEWGRAHYGMKQYKEAVSHFRKALEMDPENQIVQRDLDYAESKQADADMFLLGQTKQFFTATWRWMKKNWLGGKEGTGWRF